MINLKLFTKKESLSLVEKHSKLVIICYYYLIVSISCIQAMVAPSAKDDCLRLIDNEDNNIECVRRFINEQHFLLMNPLNMCIKFEDNPENLMDPIAVELQNVILSNSQYGRRLAKGWAKASGLEELQVEDNDSETRQQLQREEFHNLLTSSAFGLKDILKQTNNGNSESSGGSGNGNGKFTAHINPNDYPLKKLTARIVHSEKKVKDYSKIEEAIWEKISTMSTYEMKLFRTMLEQEYNNNNSGELQRNRRSLMQMIRNFSNRKETKTLLNLFNQVFNFGIKLLDHLYMSPDFILKVSFIGERILLLRKKGEPFYKVVQFLRRAHLLYKLSRCPKTKKLNPLIDDSQQQDNNNDDGNSQQSKEQDDCDKLPSESVREAKRMVSDVGSSALTRVASKVSNDYANFSLSEEQIQEYISRGTFALLTFLLPEARACPGIL